MPTKTKKTAEDKIFDTELEDADSEADDSDILMKTLIQLMVNDKLASGVHLCTAEALESTCEAEHTEN